MVKLIHKLNQEGPAMNKFYNIFLELEKDIRNNIYHSGDKLPSENHLAQKYNASRETIRKALVLLLENGYIQKKQGVGSIVLELPQFNFPVSGLTSYKELADTQHMKSETIVVSNEMIPLPEPLWNPMHSDSEAEVQYILRQRRINDEVVILDKDYFLTDKTPYISTESAQISIYDFLENEKQFPISYAKKVITVEKVTAEDIQLMTLNNDPYVVVVKSEVYLEDTTLFQHTESRHRIDKFQFVEFARRRHTLE